MSIPLFRLYTVVLTHKCRNLPQCLIPVTTNTTHKGKRQKHEFLKGERRIFSGNATDLFTELNDIKGIGKKKEDMPNVPSPLEP